MKTALIIAALILAVLTMLELRRQSAAVASLPPTQLAQLHEIQHLLIAGADLVAISGTGSMRPYLPAGVGIVAYAQLERVSFDQLQAHDLVAFRAPHGNILHQLARPDNGDWIATGLNNAHYDATRVSADNFIGRVVKTYVLQ